ncbi:MAG: serine hydrolase, partial [Chloroflexi bacterium]|nr:serine hydrolase [Chloroflexota bacterium]
MSHSRTGLAAIALIGLALCAMLAVAPRAEAAPPAEAFDAMCRNVAAVAGGEPNVTTGVVVVDLETGDRCAINADRTYRTASLYKTVVAAELWRQVAAGDVSLDQPITVEPRHHIDDAPALRPSAPYTLTVYEAAERMITFSDNGTAFALRELLGTGTVDDATEWLNMPATALATTFVTSPNDQATLFAALARGEVVDEASSAAIVDLLLRQEIVDMIPAGLRESAGVRIAHKTGTLDTYLHDAGILYAPGGDFVLVVMTENASFEGALRTIQSVAGAAYEPYAEPIAPVATATPAATPTPVATPVATVQTTTLPAAVVSSEPALRLSDDSGSAFSDTLQEPIVLAGMLVLIAAVVMAPVLVLRRRPTTPAPRGGAPERARGELALDASALAGMGTPAALRYGDNALTPEGVRLRADRSERGLVMRFGSRREDDGRPAPMSPASRSVAEVSEQPVLPSKRLQRLAEHFRSQ